MSHRVLLVDDSQIDRSVYRSMLEQQMSGLAIDEAGGVRDAIDRLRAQRYDCVFLDYEMQDGTGLSVLTAAQSFNRSPVVMLTGHADADIAVAALRAGAIDYLIKDTLEAQQLGVALQEAVMHGLQLQAREERLRRLALLQALLLQSEELILVVDLSTHKLIEAGTIGLARIGLRRVDVVDRDVRTLALWGAAGWAGFAAAVAQGPAPLATAKAGVTLEARAQVLTVETTQYMVVLARTAVP
jgi:CheY-like chemotaxis protein